MTEEKQSDNFAVWLSAKIKERRMQLTEFAEKAHISRQALYLILNDQRIPTEKTLSAIASALKMPLEEITAQVRPARMGRPFGSRRKVEHEPRVEQSANVASEENR